FQAEDGIRDRNVTEFRRVLFRSAISKSFVSSLTEQLDPMVKAWQERSLKNKAYPFLMTDVLYIDVREDHRVVSKSCHIAVGITEIGRASCRERGEMTVGGGSCVE